MKSIHHILLFVSLCILFVTPQKTSAQAGALDPMFNDSGIVINNYVAAVAAMTIQPDQKILVAGYLNQTSLIILRYNTDGTLDNSFGVGGLASTPFTTFNIPNNTAYINVASIVATQNRILIGGNMTYDNELTSPLFVLAYKQSDGSIDSTFGINGIVYNDTTTLYFGSPCSDTLYAYAGGYLALQNDGRIVQAGQMQPHCNDTLYAYAFRYTVDGTKDTSFHYATPFSNPLFSSFGAAGVVILPDSTIVIGGSGYGFGSNRAIQVPRYVCIPYSGNLADIPAGSSPGGAIAVDSATVSSFATAFICSYNNTCFLGGTLTNMNSIGSFAVVHLNSVLYNSALHGNIAPLDSSFGTDGLQNISVNTKGGTLYAAAVQPDGKILLSGSQNTGGLSVDIFELIRLTQQGSLDASFGTGGIVTNTVYTGEDFPVSVALQNDGKIVVAGTAGGSIAVLRYGNDIASVPQVADATMDVYPESKQIYSSNNVFGEFNRR